MPRKPVVGRHILYTSCVCRCVDVKSGDIIGKIIRLPRIVKDDRKRKELCQKFLAKTSLHVLQIEETKFMQAFAVMDELVYVNTAQLMNTVEYKDSTK